MNDTSTKPSTESYYPTQRPGMRRYTIVGPAIGVGPNSGRSVHRAPGSSSDTVTMQTVARQQPHARVHIDHDDASRLGHVLGYSMPDSGKVVVAVAVIDAYPHEIEDGVFYFSASAGTGPGSRRMTATTVEYHNTIIHELSVVRKSSNAKSPIKVYRYDIANDDPGLWLDHTIDGQKRRTSEWFMMRRARDYIDTPAGERGGPVIFGHPEAKRASRKAQLDRAHAEIGRGVSELPSDTLTRRTSTDSKGNTLVHGPIVPGLKVR